MKVKRIIANIDTRDVAAAERFYQDILGLELLMDHGWIATYGSQQKMTVQVSFASEGGSGTPTPDGIITTAVSTPNNDDRAIAASQHARATAHRFQEH